jgi:hypothetical protein
MTDTIPSESILCALAWQPRNGQNRHPAECGTYMAQGTGGELQFEPLDTDQEAACSSRRSPPSAEDRPP